MLALTLVMIGIDVELKGKLDLGLNVQTSLKTYPIKWVNYDILYNNN